MHLPPTIHKSLSNRVRLNDLEDQLQQIVAASTCDRIIIAGDFNADSQTNPAAYKRLVELERYGLKCVVNEPTFYRDSNSSVLDAVLVSNPLCTQMLPETCVVKKCDYTSHHHRVSVHLKISRSKQKAQYRTGRKLRNFNDNAF